VEGYAVANFNVTDRGRVTNIRIIDAKPRGLFEQPMIESLQHWLYQKNDKGKAFGVSWKFEFELKDCKLNWD
jgi:protein TonB